MKQVHEEPQAIEQTDAPTEDIQLVHEETEDPQSHEQRDDQTEDLQLVHEETEDPKAHEQTDDQTEDIQLVVNTERDVGDLLTNEDISNDIEDIDLHTNSDENENAKTNKECNEREDNSTDNEEYQPEEENRCFKIDEIVFVKMRTLRWPAKIINITGDTINVKVFNPRGNSKEVPRSSVFKFEKLKEFRGNLPKGWKQGYEKALSESMLM